MRIRSIKPEFWRSDDIAALDLSTRLLFIGLWSYVDDNGVGVDRLSSITADLFAPDLARDPRDTFATVSRGLQKLSEASLITRYTVSGRDFLHISTWAKHQRIDKPAKERYSPPTCDDAIIRETLATPSRGPRETLAPGAGEQGSRGAGDLTTSSDAPQSDKRDQGFDNFYTLYPRKEAKGSALKAWRTATKKTDAHTIITGLRLQLASLQMQDRKFQPLPATWLNAERWADEASPVTADPMQSIWDKAGRA